MSNDKQGFTLIELIIVIAILGVLAAILVPNMLTYLEKAKQVNDLQMAKQLVRATQIAVADPSNNIPPNTEIYVVWETDSFDTADISGRIYVDTSYNISSPGNYENDPAHAYEETLLIEIGTIMMDTAGDGALDPEDAWGAGRPYYYIGPAQSQAGKVTDFKFSINSSTGEISYYVDKYRPIPVDKDDPTFPWTSVIGV